MSSPSTYLECPGLDILAVVARLYNPDAPLPSDDSWIQCDACFRWRRSSGEVFSNGHCVRWFCRDGGRDCEEPCDYCQVPSCSCAPSQSYCGYSTTGYSLPEGFSIVIRFRHGEDIEVGKPWLTYRSWCQTCGMKSKGIDRRAYMMQWLSKHRHHNVAWEQLTVDAFDFKVDERIRDMYMLYVKLYRKGLISPGLKDTVKEGRLTMTEDQRSELRSLLEIVEASRFYDERAIEIGKEYSRKRTGSRMKMTEELFPTSPITKRQRKTKNQDQPSEIRQPATPVTPVTLKRHVDVRLNAFTKRQETGRETSVSNEQLLLHSKDLEYPFSGLSPMLSERSNDGLIGLPVPRIIPQDNSASQLFSYPVAPILRSDATEIKNGEEWNGMSSMLDAADNPFSRPAGYPESTEGLLTSFQKRILSHPPPSGHSFSNCFYKRL